MLEALLCYIPVEKKMALNYILILESLNEREKKNILELMRFSNIGKVLYMFLLKQTSICGVSHILLMFIPHLKRKTSWNFHNPMLENYFK